MAAPIVTLMSDFGEGSPYVAQMKAAVLQVAPQTIIVDVTHTIAPQSIREGAVVWHDSTTVFPAGTIHVGVVDPGVGSDRPIVAARSGSHCYIGPDNGLFDLVTGTTPHRRCEAIRLTEERFWRRPVSHTFHGRDIMAPVAGHLAQGVPLGDFGPPHELARRLDWSDVVVERERLLGEVIWVDRFGNLITNVTDLLLRETFGRVRDLEVRVDERLVGPIRRSYAEVASGSGVALIGSSGRLEVAVACGNAAERYGATVGAAVEVVGGKNTTRPRQVRSTTQSHDDS